jgi:hypothetical protein
MKLEGKIAIITGCNGEFGSAIVPGFAAEGCDVACVDFKQPDADIAAEKVRQRGQRSLAIAIDLCKRAEIDAIIEQVVAAFGRIDILVNTTMASHNQGVFEFQRRRLRRFAQPGRQELLSHLPGCRPADGETTLRENHQPKFHRRRARPGPGRFMDRGPRRRQWAHTRGCACVGILRHQCECRRSRQHRAQALQPRRSRTSPPAALGSNRDTGRHGRAVCFSRFRRGQLHHRNNSLC